MKMEIICSICLESEDSSLSLCDSGHTFCRKCIKGYYESLIHEGRIENLICPHVECETPEIKPHIIISIVKKEAADRYLTLLFNVFVETSKDMAWCLFCSHPVSFNGEKRKNAKCSNCNKCFCPHCRSEAHFGSCGYKENTKEIKETVEWLESNSKKCPKCSFGIEKDGGCDHMICSRCHYDFSWMKTPFHKEKKIPTRKFVDNRLKCFSCKESIERFQKTNYGVCESCKNKSCFICKNIFKKDSMHYTVKGECKIMMMKTVDDSDPE